MIDNRLQLFYIAGIALNGVALTTTAREGNWVLAGTFGVIIAYLVVRFRMAGDS